MDWTNVPCMYFTVNKINQLEWKMDVEFPKP